MDSPDLLVICVSAMTAVFVLLGFLALVMRALMAALPEREKKIDPATIAAVTAAAAVAIPGTKVTKVEEVQ